MGEEFKINEADLTLSDVKSGLKSIQWFIENNIPIYYYTHLNELKDYFEHLLKQPVFQQRTAKDEMISKLIKKIKLQKDLNKKLYYSYGGLRDFFGITVNNPDLAVPLMLDNLQNIVYTSAYANPITATLANMHFGGLGLQGLYNLKKNNTLGLNFETTLNAASTIPISGLVIKNVNRTVPMYYNRYKNFNRYVIDNLNPRSYSDHRVKEVILPFIEPLYKNIPRFFNNKRPKWYKRDKVGNIILNFEDELRFQNYGIWTDIPETEIPRWALIKNKDGSWRPSNQAIINQAYGKHGDPASILSDKFVKQKSFKDIDVYGTIGGLHSNYNYIGTDKNTGNLYYVLDDTQNLNPQWYLTHPIKKLFPKKSKAYNFLHELGGKHIGKPFGFNNHEIKLGLELSPDGEYTLNMLDPTDIKFNNKDVKFTDFTLIE